jgi:Uma2 family endonuclease
MNVVLREPWPVERFLSWEDAQEGKHEFDGTRIIEMTGGSRAHQRIIFNLMRLLTEHLDSEAFDAVQEMRVEVAGKVRYPDVTVCAGRIPDGTRTLRSALVIFEVLSDQTADIDRQAKRIEYASLPGMRRYILLEQHSIAATILALSAGNWHETRITSGGLPLPELGIELPIGEIYRSVRIDPSSGTQR